MTTTTATAPVADRARARTGPGRGTDAAVHLVRDDPGTFALAQTIVEILVPVVVLLLLPRVRA